MKKGSNSILKTKSVNLRDAVVVIFRHKWLILLTFLTTAAAVSLFTFLMSDQYESRMKILVKNVRADVPVSAERTDASIDRNEVSESEITSEIELLKSRDLLEQVVRKNNLAVAENNTQTSEQDVERALYKLEKDLQIQAVKKANIIEVSYTSKSPETAAAVLNQLGELYLEKHLRVHHPPGTYEFFKNQADEYKQELQDSENKLSTFQQKMDVISIDRQKELSLTKLTEAKSRLDDLNGQIKETDKRIEEINKTLSATDKRISTQSRTLPNQYSVERLNTMLVELRNRRIQLLAKFRADDRVVKEVDEQIRETEDAYRKAVNSTSIEQSSDVNPLRQSLESELSKARIEQAGRNELRDNLAQQVTDYQNQLSKLEGVTTIHNDLTRRVQQADENYQLYAKKQEESRIADELDKQKISNVSIAEAPTTPRVPYKTNRPLTLALGLVFGLLLGLGSAITAEFLRETIHTPFELEKLTDAPVLATIAFHRNPKDLLGENFYESDGDDFKPPHDEHTLARFSPVKKQMVST